MASWQLDVRSAASTVTSQHSFAINGCFNRIGDGALVYLGSAELAAVAALKGSLPNPKEYFDIVNKKVAPNADEIYRYLQFDDLDEFSLTYLDHVIAKGDAA